ncbi:hypothetical protein AJ79_03340 [Helicocarpus griseus UAMH5409]|uniref:F-box domain-containing protein n=1 Tax=Helicocarpus griseus UAMH5409 TaxID=1447875 RepID=A0A2B7XYA5_9EURO|nr:hypothetical protein AJ79_03340 [Helicocarpus griseus UAMH5409]
MANPTPTTSRWRRIFDRMRTMYSRLFITEIVDPNDGPSHNHQSSCTECKYSTFDRQRYCPELYRRYVTPGQERNRQRSMLHRLPPETVHLIIGYLEAYEVECLRHVCRLFYHNYSPERPLISQERFELQCLMEREPWANTLACRKCRNHRHHRSMFYPLDWDINPLDRECKEYRQLLQFCPYSSFSFKDVQRLVRLPRREQFWPCAHNSFDLAMRLQGRKISTVDGQWCIVRRNSNCILATTVLVAIYHTAKVPLPQEAHEAFKALDVPLCPHLHLGDPEVMAQYTPGHGAAPSHIAKASPGCNCPDCVGFRCPFCHSTFRFRVLIQRGSAANACLGVEVYRNLGTLQDSNDPLWLSQLSVPIGPELASRWSEELVNLHRRICTDVPQHNSESRCIAKELKLRARNVLREKEVFTRASGNSNVRIKDLHKPLCKPRLGYFGNKDWHWEGYGTDGYLVDKNFQFKDIPQGLFPLYTAPRRV